jgi:hypothetical protein
MVPPESAPSYGTTDSSPETKPSLTAVPLPEGLEAELRQLEEWALSNESAAKSDARKLWSLKGLAIVLTIVSAVVSYWKLSDLGALFASLAGALVVLDGLIQPGRMRNAHYQAFFDARELGRDVLRKWKAESPTSASEAKELSKRLLEQIGRENRRIAKALRGVEADRAT